MSSPTAMWMMRVPCRSATWAAQQLRSQTCPEAGATVAACAWVGAPARAQSGLGIWEDADGERRCRSFGHRDSTRHRAGRRRAFARNRRCATRAPQSAFAWAPLEPYSGGASPHRHRESPPRCWLWRTQQGSHGALTESERAQLVDRPRVHVSEQAADCETEKRGRERER
jgi:hypothetical protein